MWRAALSRSSRRAGGLATVLVQEIADRLAQQLVGRAIGLLNQFGEGLGLALVECQARLKPVLTDPALQVPIAPREMAMDLRLGEPVVIQIVEAGVRKLRVERAQLGEVEGIVVAVVDGGEES